MLYLSVNSIISSTVVIASNVTRTSIDYSVQCWVAVQKLLHLRGTLENNNDTVPILRSPVL